MSEPIDRNALWLLWERGRSFWAETAPEARAEAERLFAELFELEPKSLGTALRRKRFRSAALVELLLEKSRGALPQDPERAEGLAMLAGVVLGKLRAEGNREMAAALLTRMAWLSGNACRLLGEEEHAESALTSASFAMSPTVEACDQAFFLRALGLLRWEQVRSAEAVALLSLSCKVFRALGVAQEEAASRAMLGLLLVEEGDFEGGLSELTEVAVKHLETQHAALAAREGWAYTLCLASLGHSEDAQGAIEEAQRVLPLLTDDEQLNRARWLEARARRELGETTTAASLSRVVFQWFLDQKNLSAAALSMLDLVEALTAAGLAAEIEPRIERFEQTFAGHKALPALLAALRSNPGPAGARFLRRALRARGCRLEALPFV